MAKGTVAKAEVIKRIAQAFGEDYIGEVDKKYYVWATEDGARVQIALSLTCPKNMVTAESAPNVTLAPAGDFNFEDENTYIPKPALVNSEISQEEKDNIATLMAQLGL